MSFNSVKFAELADGYLMFSTGQFGIAGDNDLYWDRAGNKLGVGTSTPTNTFHVKGKAQGDGIMLEDIAGSLSEWSVFGSTARIEASGTMQLRHNSSLDLQTGATTVLRVSGSRVGIGGFTPTLAPLEVLETATAPTALATVLALKVDTSGTADAGLGASIEFYLENDAGSEVNSGIISSVWESAAAGSESSSFRFTTVNSGSSKEAVIIKNDAKVGINTFDPQNTLDVSGGVAIGSTYAGTNTAPTDGLLVEGNVLIGATTEVNTQIPFEVSTSTGLAAAFVSDEATRTVVSILNSSTGTPSLSFGDLATGSLGIIGYDKSESSIAFVVGSSGNNPGEPGVSNTFTRLVLDGITGNVGVGLAYDPQAKLDVRGDGYFDGYLNPFTSEMWGLGSTDKVWDQVFSNNINIKESSTPVSVSGFGRLYVNAADNNLHYIDSLGTDFDLTPNGQAVGATEGADGYITFFTGASGIAGDNDLFWDRANNRLGIHTETPKNFLDVSGSAAIGSTYAGTQAAPTDGLLVSGKVGIGTVPAAAQEEVLRVKGTITAEDGYLESRRNIFGSFGTLMLDGGNGASDGGSSINLNYNNIPKWIIYQRNSGTAPTTFNINLGGSAAPDLSTFRITPSEKFGIYRVVEPQSRMDINGNLTIGSTYAGVNAAPTDGLIVEGQVGINKSSPASGVGNKLHISANSATTTAAAPTTGDIVLIDNGNGTGIINFRANIGSAGSHGLFFTDDAEGAGGVIYNHSVDRLTIRANASTVAIFENNGLGVFTSSTPTNTLDVGGNAAIGVAYAGVETAPTNGLLVQENVGIRTTSPEANLHVAGDGYFDGYLNPFIENIGLGSIDKVWDQVFSNHFNLQEVAAPINEPGFGRLYVSSADNDIHFIDSAGTDVNLSQASGVTGSGASGQLTYWTGGSTLGADTDLVWDTTANKFGIGTASPSATLHVAGDGYFDGYLMPFNDNTVGLGTPDKRWRDLYVGPDSLHIIGKPTDVGIDRDWQIGLDSSGDFRVKQGVDTAISASSAGVVTLGESALNSNLGSLVVSNAAGQGKIVLRGSQGTLYFLEDGSSFIQRFSGTGLTLRAQTADDIIIENGSGGKSIFIEGTTRNVGLSTGTPQNRLDVNGAAVIGSSYAGVETADTDGLLVEGRVGIGTTSPEENLHVESTTGNADVKIESTGTNSSRLILKKNLIGGSSSLLYERGGSGYWQINQGINTEDLTIYNEQLSESLMRFTSADNLVGIKTDSPQATLHVHGDGYFDGYVNPFTDNMWGLGSTDKRWSDIALGPDSIHIISTTADTVGVDRHWNIGINSVGDLSFNHESNETLTITPDGNIGIGTINPQDKVDIKGTLRIENDTTESIDLSSSNFVNPVIKMPSAGRIKGTSSGGIIWGLAATDGRISVVDASETDWLDLHYDGSVDYLAGVLRLGDDAAASSHSLGHGDVQIERHLEVDGYLYADNSVVLSRESSASDIYIDGTKFITAITDTSSPRTVYLPNAADFTNHVFAIKDESGGAGSNNITVSPADTGQNVDGTGGIVINTNYGFVKAYSDGTNWYSI